MDFCLCSNISDETKYACIPCQPQCRECDSSLSCTSCEFRLVLKNGRCLASCQSGLYETDDYGCDACHPACATCRGPHADHCVTCAAGYADHQGQCVDQCPSRYWMDLTGKQCLSCPPGCETCRLDDSSYGLVCQECSPSWQLDASTLQCLSPSTNICSDGSFTLPNSFY